MTTTIFCPGEGENGADITVTIVQDERAVLATITGWHARKNDMSIPSWLVPLVDYVMLAGQGNKVWATRLITFDSADAHEPGQWAMEKFGSWQHRFVRIGRQA